MKPQYPTARQANITLTILVLAYIFSLLDRQILSLMVGPIRKDLAISDFQISLLQGIAFALFYSLLGLPIGRLADRYNRTRIVAVGIFLWSLTTAACGLARTFTTLFFARMGVGVGEAALAPSAYSLISDLVPPAKLPRAVAIFSVGTTIGSGAAYILGSTVLTLVGTTQTFDLPLVGTLRPWQLAFIIAGLPGILVSVLLVFLREPPRQGLVKTTDAVSTAVPWGEIARSLEARKGAYGAIFAATSCMAMLVYGTLNWYPSFLIRTYGVAANHAGFIFGGLYIVFGILGTFTSGWLTEYLAKRGFTDAPLRTPMLVAIALTPLAIGPLMPNLTLACVMAAPTFFFMNAYWGVSLASLQLITPNQMRAVVSSLLLLVTTLIGLGAGSSIIAGLTDFVFHNDLDLRYSLALIEIVLAPIAALIFWLGLRPYRAALVAAEAWQPVT